MSQVTTYAALSISIAEIEEWVRMRKRIRYQELAGAIRILDALQDGAGVSPSVVRAARYTQHWLSQYIAASLIGDANAPGADRGDSLSRMALEACDDLRVAMSRGCRACDRGRERANS